MFDVTQDERRADERCGRCGEPVSVAGSVCPSCGALLDAYRTPGETTPATDNVATDADDLSGRERTEARIECPVVGSDDPAPETLDPANSGAMPDAEAGTGSDVPGRAVTSTVAEDLVDETPVHQPAFATPSVALPRRSSPDQRRDPRPSVRARPVTRVIEPPRPRKPGYVTRGTVEPVILLGVVALVLAICLVGFASVISVRGIAVAGFVLGAFGVLGILVALLVVLVRREHEIG